MRIAFILPAPVRVPGGGAAVVVRHAEALAARGHAVRVIAPWQIPGESGPLRAAAVGLHNRVHGVSDATPFKGSGIEITEPRRVSVKGLYEEAVIATGIQTVNLVTQAGSRGWWFIQGDETFIRPDARDAWASPIRKVTCAHWLATEIREAGATVEGVVPNAVDPSEFAVDMPLEERSDSVLALYHRHPVKGPETLIAAFEQLRERRPGITLRMFCARAPSHRIPRGVEVIIRPERDALRRLYNQTSVFLHTSRREGWALTPMEAAACGAAVVATDSLGPSEYLSADRSMIRVPPGDADALVTGTLSLLDDPARRVAQARAAVQDVARFSWVDSADAFERLLVRGAKHA